MKQDRYDMTHVSLWADRHTITTYSCLLHTAGV